MKNFILVTRFDTLNRDFSLNRDSLNRDFTVYTCSSAYASQMDIFFTLLALEVLKCGYLMYSMTVYSRLDDRKVFDFNSSYILPLRAYGKNIQLAPRTTKSYEVTLYSRHRLISSPWASHFWAY